METPPFTWHHRFVAMFIATVSLILFMVIPATMVAACTHVLVLPLVMLVLMFLFTANRLPDWSFTWGFVLAPPVYRCALDHLLVL